jgi:hypothetical protein
MSFLDFMGVYNNLALKKPQEPEKKVRRKTKNNRDLEYYVKEFVVLVAGIFVASALYDIIKYLVLNGWR